MGRILAFFAFEIALLVTPMIWPTIPFEIGMAVYGFAFALALMAAVYWWKDKPARGKYLRNDPLKRIKCQKTFPLFEAACLLAGTPIQTAPTGEAAGYLYQLKSHLADSKKAKAEAARNHRRSMTAPQALAIFMSRDSIIRNIPDDFEISRDDLSSYANMIGVNIDGLTNV
jgi:hypothetical protein